MFEIVPSEWMRNYFKEKNRKFSDWEKAALIWNSPIYTWREKVVALKEFSEVTNDAILKNQIRERVEYEEKAYRLLTDNFDKKYVYVVFNQERNTCGYFADFERARRYAVKYSTDYEGACHIEKQLIFSDETKNDVKQPWISGHNMIKAPVFPENGYSGRESAYAGLNSKGSIMNLYSMEMTDDENERVDIQNRERFEYRFFKIPFGMEAGTIVKMVDGGTFAVLAQGEADWNRYMLKTDRNPLYYDYSDIQAIVYTLTDEGYWSHWHVNPMYLEPDLPGVLAGNKKDELYVDALKALGSFLKDRSKEKNELALRASRAYAGECGKGINWSRLVYEVDTVEKLLW